MTRAINDLRRHIAPLESEIQLAISRVLRSGWYILGEEVRAFEAAFADYCGVSHCVSVANGTEALELALRALEITDGARVATVANAGMYSSVAILAAGARPLFIDIAAETLLMDLDLLQQRISSEKIDAVIATHLFGNMVDMPRLRSICASAQIALIEDCAQAHGAELGGSKAGAFADAGCFSFYPTKNLGAIGDGGAIVTTRPDIADRLSCLRQYGWTDKYVSSRAGGRNSRLDELQAAVLRIQLPHLDGWNERRREIANAYSEAIRHKRVRCPTTASVSVKSCVAHLYVVQSADRDDLRRHLATAGVTCDVHYPIPDHHQVSLRAFSGVCQLPITERACKEVITLPCFPEMSDEEVLDIAASINQW